MFVDSADILVPRGPKFSNTGHHIKGNPIIVHVPLTLSVWTLQAIDPCVQVHVHVCTRDQIS